MLSASAFQRAIAPTVVLMDSPNHHSLVDFLQVG
jgi:hypothetical protein